MYVDVAWGGGGFLVSLKVNLAGSDVLTLCSDKIFLRESRFEGPRYPIFVPFLSSIKIMYVYFSMPLFTSK